MTTDHYYHVTYYSRLPSIAEKGLLTSAGGSGAIGQGGHQGHSTGRVFLATEFSAKDWFDTAEMIADVQWGARIGTVPVLIRVSELELDLRKDPAGEYEAFFVESSIEPQFLEVFNGEEWVPIEDWTEIDPTKGLEDAVEPDPDDYDSEEEYLVALDRYEDDDEREYEGFLLESPLFPQELR